MLRKDSQVDPFFPLVKNMNPFPVHPKSIPGAHQNDVPQYIHLHHLSAHSAPFLRIALQGEDCRFPLIKFGVEESLPVPYTCYH